MNVTRRLFLRHTAAVGAVGATIAAPAVAEVIKTPRERMDAAIAELKAAAKEVDPRIERWDVARPDGDDMALAILITAHRRTGEYEGDGTYESGRPNIFGNRDRWRVRLLGLSPDGQRSFEVRNNMDRMVLPEPRLNTFIGKKIE